LIEHRCKRTRKRSRRLGAPAAGSSSPDVISGASPAADACALDGDDLMLGSSGAANAPAGSVLAR
jgi:hypothetical protein